MNIQFSTGYISVWIWDGAGALMLYKNNKTLIDQEITICYNLGIVIVNVKEKFMEASKIKSTIMFGDYSNAELESFATAIRYARANLGHTVKRQLKAGSTVKFTSGKTGQTFQGTVDSVKVKYVIVRTPAGLYRVPANMIEVM
jgi:hypothetical protein